MSFFIYKWPYKPTERVVLHENFHVEKQTKFVLFFIEKKFALPVIHRDSTADISMNINLYSH